MALPLKMNVTFTMSNSVLCDTLQNTALYKVLQHISAVYLSAFLHRFLGLAFASLCTHTTLALRFSPQHSLSLESYIKNNLSLCVCQLPASLTLHYFSISTSEQSFSKISYKISSKISLLFVLVCKMCAMTTARLNR